MKKRNVRVITRNDLGRKVPPPYHTGVGRLFFALDFGEFAMLTPSPVNFILRQVCNEQ